MGLSINDSVYSCIFFFLTGLHFFHLLVGLLLIIFIFWLSNLTSGSLLWTCHRLIQEVKRRSYQKRKIAWKIRISCSLEIGKDSRDQRRIKKKRIGWSTAKKNGSVGSWALWWRGQVFGNCLAVALWLDLGNRSDERKGKTAGISRMNVNGGLQAQRAIGKDSRDQRRIKKKRIKVSHGCWWRTLLLWLFFDFKNFWDLFIL